MHDKTFTFTLTQEDRPDVVRYIGICRSVLAEHVPTRFHSFCIFIAWTPCKGTFAIPMQCDCRAMLGTSRVKVSFSVTAILADLEPELPSLGLISSLLFISPLSLGCRGHKRMVGKSAHCWSRLPVIYYGTAHHRLGAFDLQAAYASRVEAGKAPQGGLRHELRHGHTVVARRDGGFLGHHPRRRSRRLEAEPRGQDLPISNGARRHDPAAASPCMADLSYGNRGRPAL